MEEIARKYDCSLIVLFGSKAKGDVHAESDTDVAFLTGRVLSMDEELELVRDLSLVLKSDIDAVNINKASPLILYQIFRHGKPLYEKERGLFADYIGHSFRLYEESMPLYTSKIAQL